MSLRDGFRSCLKAAFTRIPLVGRLTEVPREPLQQAGYETLTTVVFATMPFWFIPGLGHFIFKVRPSISEIFENGEGLIYASVLLGPLFYVLTKRYGTWSLRGPDKESKFSMSMSFPYGTAFVAITAVTCVISGVAFLLLRKGTIDPEFNEAGIRTLSWILVIGATGIFFLITAYRNMLDDLASNKAAEVVDEHPRGEAEFYDRWMGSKE